MGFSHGVFVFTVLSDFNFGQYKKGGNIMKQVKVFLNEGEIPRQWYNILADMPTPMSPPLHPGTGKPLNRKEMAAIFPMNLVEQEMSTER